MAGKSPNERLDNLIRDLEENGAIVEECSIRDPKFSEKAMEYLTGKVMREGEKYTLYDIRIIEGKRIPVYEDENKKYWFFASYDANYCCIFQEEKGKPVVLMRVFESCDKLRETIRGLKSYENMWTYDFVNDEDIFRKSYIKVTLSEKYKSMEIDDFVNDENIIRKTYTGVPLFVGGKGPSYISDAVRFVRKIKEFAKEEEIEE